MVAVFMFITAGCALSPAPKPEVGPAGKPTETKSNPPLTERFKSPPVQLYDLEAIAGTVFEGINTGNWQQAETGAANLQAAWRQAKEFVGEMKGVKEGDEALGSLFAGIKENKADDAFESLIKFMGSVVDVGKSYKLSPVSDIITIGNSIRNVGFYVEGKDWLKAGAKAQELDDTWKNIKPSLEQVGILGEITKTHSYVRQLRDAVGSENKNAAKEKLADLNKSVGQIREYYRGR